MPLGLLVIARNDAAVIEKTILSAQGLVDHVTVVLDEKSTDATRSICEKLGVTVIACELPDSISEARNAGIELARSASDYLLMLDPGDTYEGTLPHHLEEDVYEVWIHDRLQRTNEVKLFRSSVGVHYKGTESDRIVVPEGLTRGLATHLIYQRAGNADEERRAKSDAHIAELLTWASAHSDDAHVRFVLGQSYRDAEDFEKARDWYEKRLKFGDMRNEECFASALELAYITEHHDAAAITHVTAAYLRAHELSPLRADPLFHLACYLREQGAVATAWHFARRAAEMKIPHLVGTDTDVEIYEWKALAELAIESWMLGDRGTAMKLLSRVMSIRPDYKSWIEEQLVMVSTEDPPDRTMAWQPEATR